MRPHPFALLLLDNGETSASFALDGRTIADAAAWVQDGISKRGLDAGAFTLAKHYTIPSHPVGESAPFDASAPQAFDELSAWFSDSARVLEPIVAPNPNAAPVRCWPHHFDIATLVEVAPGKTVGSGWSRATCYYAEPYFYVNMYRFRRAADEQTSRRRKLGTLTSGSAQCFQVRGSAAKDSASRLRRFSTRRSQKRGERCSLIGHSDKKLFLQPVDVRRRNLSIHFDERQDALVPRCRVERTVLTVGQLNVRSGLTHVLRCCQRTSTRCRAASDGTS